MRSYSSALASASPGAPSKTRSCSLVITYFSTPSHARSSSAGSQPAHSGCCAIAASVCWKKACVDADSSSTLLVLASALRTKSFIERNKSLARGCCTCAMNAWYEDGAMAAPGAR